MRYRYLLFYIAAMSLMGFLSMGTDKRRARKGLRRIPEKTLFLIAALGGSIGSIAGMFAFRHKTKHLSFRIGLPAILLAQAVLAFLILRYTGRI
ncbi:MAG: DUF1294 domain-containing protein [Lachnospiraceae bacterium]